MCSEWIFKHGTAETYKELTGLVPILPEDPSDLPSWFFENGYKKGDSADMSCLCFLSPMQVSKLMLIPYIYDGLNLYFGEECIKKYSPEIVSYFVPDEVRADSGIDFNKLDLELQKDNHAN